MKSLFFLLAVLSFSPLASSKSKCDIASICIARVLPVAPLTFLRTSSFACQSELCHRGGSEMTSLMVDGAKLSVRRPRARKDGEEVFLPNLEKMRDRELLDAQMTSRLMRSVSTRNYAEVINGVR